jgi:MFS family permease
MGITNGIGQFGSFISPLICGYLVATLPDGSYDFGDVFLFWSVLAFFAAVAALFLKETPIDYSDFEVNNHP